MSVTFTAFHDAVVARLVAKLPAIKKIEKHGGTFDLDELKRVSTKAPAIFVCHVGTGRGHRRGDGSWMVPLNMAAVVLTKDEVLAGVGKTDRGTAAAALATAVTIAVQGHRMGLSGVEQPEDLLATNEFNGKIDNAGVAMWQVTWTQGVLVGDGPDEAIAALSQLFVNGEQIYGPGTTVDAAGETP